MWWQINQILGGIATIKSKMIDINLLSRSIIENLPFAFCGKLILIILSSMFLKFTQFLFRYIDIKYTFVEYVFYRIQT